MRTQFFKAASWFAMSVLLGCGAGCQSYGGKEVAVHLTTTPQLTSPDVVAYIVTIEGWSDAIDHDGYDYAQHHVPPPGFTPKNAQEFADALEPFRVRQHAPPVTTSVKPWHAIYVVQTGGVNGVYYWDDIIPAYSSPNDFTVGVTPDAEKSQ